MDRREQRTGPFQLVFRNALLTGAAGNNVRVYEHRIRIALSVESEVAGLRTLS